MWKFAILITSHNRVNQTLHCIETLTKELSGATNLVVDIFLTDDGSTDGTSQIIKSRFPNINLICGDGALFWAGGMREAWNAAEKKGVYNFLVWVNDDVEFYPNAVKASFERAVELNQKAGTKQSILVGSILDPDTKKITYGGVNRPSTVLRPLYFDLITTSGFELRCETFNGNFVIIPISVANAIGGINPIFRHAFGDYDYGLRTSQAGFMNIVLACPVGECRRNPWVSPSKIKSMTISQRWHRMTGPKLYPLRGWLVYTRAHTGFFWPFFFLRPYWEVIFPWAFSRLR